MGLHKLTAGNGYTYLTRQVAAHDSTERGARSLGDYYDEKGEAPGRWTGAGLESLGIEVGERVTEEEMTSLFGIGRHPRAAALAEQVLAAGGSLLDAQRAGALGRAFPQYVGASAFQREVAEAFSTYNRARGVHWRSSIPVEVRAELRTQVATRLFVEQHGREPVDARELSGFIACASRQPTTAVAGYDLTFSPVKSVSTLWAVASRDIARQIEEAHHAAVDDTVAWLEREVAFTRLGRGGIRQVPVRGMVAAAFTHRDSRAGDPDLHTHLAVSNKVQATEADGGAWLALDGRTLYAAKVSASERYNTRLEVELRERLGLQFDDRTTSAGRRPVREVRGVDPLLAQHWSKRRSAIDVRRTELAREFQVRHGRPPTVVEALALAQQATLETREAKHLPRSEADQRRTWRAEATDLLGAEGLETMIQCALADPPERFHPSDGWTLSVARQVIDQVAAHRATWQVWHVRAEAERQVRRAAVPRALLDAALESVVTAALDEHSVRLDVDDPVQDPRVLRRPDGSSVYTVQGSAIYTSTGVLRAEEGILAAALLRDGRMVSGSRVAIAVAEASANGIDLNEGQVALVTALLGSGRRVQLGMAPAGTGKTTAMSVLANAWTASGGQVVGLAPSAQATHELGEALGSSTDTLAKLAWSVENAPEVEWPSWLRAVGPHSLIVVDEAGQAGTTELATVVDFAVQRGASVRLIGDDQQLAAVGAGGVLRDLARRTGATTLTHVHRFSDPAEAAVTLAVREGDVSALGFYADHGRIHVGDLASVADQAYAAWRTDQAAGLDSLLLAPTRELVTALNQRARTERLAAAPAPAPAEVDLADGTRASAGDVVVTRRNARRLTLTRTRWVTNGDRWLLEGAHQDGSVTVRHLELDRLVTLPAAYVAEHLQLGYASTVHGAQGMTVDSSHTVVSGEESRQLLYVALSRGRHANHVYLANAYDGDPHSVLTRDALLPPTSIDILKGVLGRDGAQVSATTARHEAESAATQLHAAAVRYADALGVAAASRLGAKRLAWLDGQLKACVPGLTHQAAYPTLREHLALRWLDGQDPVALVLEASTERGLEGIDDLAATIDWRLPVHASSGPLPWVAGVPQDLLETPDWGPYLQARAGRVAALAARIRMDAEAWTLTRVPAWARPFAEDGHERLRGQLAVWRAAFDVSDADERPTGRPQLGADAAAVQRLLEHEARRAVDLPTRASLELPDVVASDPQAHALRARLTDLSRAGVDVQALIRNALSEDRPLPHDIPADALWWRIAAHLGPATLHLHDAGSLSPSWSALISDLLGAETAERIMADAAWPALVAAVSSAPAEWTPSHLLGTALDRLVVGSQPVVPVSDLCSALVWRVALLCDPVPDEPPPFDGEAYPLDDVPLATPVARIAQLHTRAAAFYGELMPRSWAPAYLRDRLGVEPEELAPFTLGYAPPGPTTLIRHLITGPDPAAEQELIDAGLARPNAAGEVVDVFRDRLVFAVRDSGRGDIVGFIGRRNPHRDDSLGPKYLNTRTTSAFSKSDILFGLAEQTDVLREGAIPVLVEGPMDALAVTLAGAGRAVGIAPMGTSLTAHQVSLLVPHFASEPHRIVVATDADPAGEAALERAYAALTARSADPGVVALPRGADPADLLAAHGRTFLRDRLLAAVPLVEHLIAQEHETFLVGRDEPARWARLIDRTASLIAQRPPSAWATSIAAWEERLTLPPGLLHLEVVDAAARLAAGEPMPTPDARGPALPPITAQGTQSAELERRLTPPAPSYRGPAR